MGKRKYIFFKNFQTHVALVGDIIPAFYLVWGAVGGIVADMLLAEWLLVDHLSLYSFEIRIWSVTHLSCISLHFIRSLPALLHSLNRQ